MALQPLGRLRLRLTAWYVVTFGVIIVLLGTGLFVAIRRQLASQLDESLRAATRELARAARIREMEATAAHGNVVDAVEELRIPDRTLYLLSIDGRAIIPPRADAWIGEAARHAAVEGAVDREWISPREQTLRLHGERIALASGEPVIVVAVANKLELEHHYASLIAAFGGAAAVALVLVAAGGWLLVRKSTEPIERTVESMRRFMADAAHELRTPITVLRGRADVALQQPRDAAAYASTIAAMAAESGRLGRIVDDLLTLARADTGELPRHRERVYLDDLASDAAGAASALAQARGVALTVEEYEEAPVDGDPALLRQLLMILLDNAVKFTPAGGRVRLNVSAAAGRASVAVEDTGIGIAPEQLPHVFDRFYRGDPSRSRASDGASDGAGLGLSIARWIADAHGAAIVIDSAPGRGTRVAIQFPIVAPESRPAM